MQYGIRHFWGKSSFSCYKFYTAYLFACVLIEKTDETTATAHSPAVGRQKKTVIPDFRLQNFPLIAKIFLLYANKVIITSGFIPYICTV
jgi:hypothetical protein